MAHSHYIVDDDNRFIIDGDTRELSNVSGNRPSLMQYDHKSERFTFEMPRIIEGHDMSTCDLLEVYYTNTSSGTSKSARTVISDMDVIEDLQVDPEDDTKMFFSWLITDKATKQAGTLAFQFKFSCIGDTIDSPPAYLWHSGVYATVGIQASLNISGEIVEAYPNAISYLNLRTEYLSDQLEELRAQTGKGVYVGDGDMPDDCTIQIILDGDETVVEEGDDDPSTDDPSTGDDTYTISYNFDQSRISVSGEPEDKTIGGELTLYFETVTGYVFGSLTATLGGEELSFGPDMYIQGSGNFGKLYIESVTGDIVITAEIVEAENGDDSGDDSGDTGGDSGGTGGGTTQDTYPITHILSNVTIDNQQTTIAKNSPYVAMIYADVGYKMGAYRLTIGGVDHYEYITEFNDLSGIQIFIPNDVINGNVEITAFGSAVPTD